MVQRAKSKIPRRKDPLGFGLDSIPKPLQSLWLIYQGNPYFEADVEQKRQKLAIPTSGFTNVDAYDTWLENCREGHSHESDLRINVFVLRRLEHQNLRWPEDYFAPSPCCAEDPLHVAAKAIAVRYGIYEARDEPGFEQVVADVARYLTVNIWTPRRSLRFRGSIKGKVPVREVAVIDAMTGKRIRIERKRILSLGPDSAGGGGGLLPDWYQWWKLDRRRKTLGGIVDLIEQQYGVWYDERSIRRAIKQVERLLKPVTI